MKVLVANVGSTSYKFQIYDSITEKFLCNGNIERIGSPNSIVNYSNQSGYSDSFTTSLNYAEAVKLSLNLMTSPEAGVIKDLTEIQGIGFKTIHAGHISGAVLIDDSVIEVMEDYNIVVPAHNRPYIDTIKLFREMLPDMPLVGVFETWFHQSIPEYASSYSISQKWSQDYGIKKYGFHGASHRFISETVTEKYLEGEKKNSGRVISCHLGGSSSLCAIKAGKSIDTSMGFSTQSGLPMNNRIGDLDPMIIFYLLSKTNLTPAELQQELMKNAGLKGMSGLSGDVRDLEDAADQGDQWADLALKNYEYHLKLYIGAYTAALNGVDVIAFTGGIGENDWRMRADVISGLEYLGVKLDQEANKSAIKQEKVISSKDSSVLVVVIPANEGKIVGRETAKLLEGHPDW